MSKQPIFLFECNRTHDVSQHLNGEMPYRHNLIDYYILNNTCTNGYEHLMHINAQSDYARTSDMVLQQKKKVAKDLAKRNPGHPVMVLAMEVDEQIPVNTRILEAIQVYQKTGIAIRTVHS